MVNAYRERITNSFAMVGRIFLMNPTQEQIEAALAYDNLSATDEQRLILRNYDYRYIKSINAMTILAAAYRDAIAENEELKAAIPKLNQP